MRRIMHKYKRYNKILQILGITMVIIGSILVLKIIPSQLLLFILGIFLIIMGLFFFKTQ